MSTRTKTAPTPARPPQTKTAPRPASTFESTWLTGVAGRELLGIRNYPTFLRLVQSEGVRTYQLTPGSKVRFNREDLMKIASEAVHIGLPDRSASA